MPHKVGDNVIIAEITEGDPMRSYSGRTGTVVDENEDLVRVSFDALDAHWFWYDEALPVDHE